MFFGAQFASRRPLFWLSSFVNAILFSPRKRSGFFSLAILLITHFNSAHAQQCTLPSRIFLPDADTARFQQLGMAVAMDGEYMIAGMQDHSSLQIYAGIALVYKLDAEHNWVQIAELKPSDPGKYGKFGSAVDIVGNTIVVRGHEYNDLGISRYKLYVFEKPSAGEWTSATESYTIAKDFGDGYNYHNYVDFRLNTDELVCLVKESGDLKIEVFKKSGGVFSLNQLLELSGATESGSYEWNLAVTDELIAIGSEQYHLSDRSNGIAFVFEKVNSTYNSIPAQLKASEQTQDDWRAFGFNIAAHGSTVVVLGLRYTDPSYIQTFYVFERPVQGWQDAALPQLFEHDGYVMSNSDLVINENYILTTAGNYEGVIGFKKSGGTWTAGVLPFQINSPDADETLFGWQIAMDAEHLVIGCPARFQFYEASDEYLSAYFSPDGAWETPDLECRQRLSHTSLNAAGDFFGEAFSVYNNRIAIAAEGDDRMGADAGVVYVFDSEETGNAATQLIYSPERENSSGFGNKIAMGDSIMFIAAPFKDSVGVDGKAVFFNIGKVYIYRLSANGWTYSSQIIAPDIHSDVTFGQNVVWSPGYCAVTEFYSGNSESIGRVHIYKENKTNGKFDYLATLDPEHHLRSDFFGKSIVMTDSMMVIGTGGSAPNSSYRQSAYVFIRKGEWTSTTEDAKLMCSDTGWSDRFGASVSMFGEYIVVGAPNWPGLDPRPIPRSYIVSGAVYIFKRPHGGWKGLLTETAKLMPSDPTESGNFGASVVIDHNDIFVGSPNVSARYNYSANLSNNNNRLIPGKVYHYTMPQGGWTTTNQEKRQLQSFEPEVVDGYGASMYVSDRYLYVGVMLDDTEKGFRTGSVQTMMQLPAIDAPTVLCADQNPAKLLGFPKGGQWSGPGVTSSGIFNPAVAGGGIHNITYLFSGCESSVEIKVLPQQMVVHEQSPAVQTKCTGTSVPVAFRSGEDPEMYTWYYRETLNHKQLKFDSMKQVINPLAPGYYEVVVSRGDCPARRAEFRIIDEPPVDITITPVPLICSSEMVQLEVTPTTGIWTGIGVSDSGHFDPGSVAHGSYTLRYTVQTPGGCQWKDSVTVDVNILKQPKLVYDNRPICGNNPVELVVENTDGTEVLHWYRDETEISTGRVGHLSTSIPGNYKVATTKGNCRLETETKSVSGEHIEITIEQTVICSDAPVRLNATPGEGTWTGPAITAQGDFNPTGFSDGVYPQVYTLVTPIGCTWQRTFDLVVDKLQPPALRTDITEICVTRPATLTLDNIDERSSIRWFNDSGELASESPGMTVTTNVPGVYYADVTKHACALRTPLIQLVAQRDSIFVPNVITVNADNTNDHFEIHAEGLDDIRLDVFNRYGRVVYKTNDINFKWPAQGVGSGLYFWRLSYRTCVNKREETKGWLQILGN